MYKPFKAVTHPVHGVPTETNVIATKIDQNVIMTVMANTQVIVITKEQAMAFFGLIEASKPAMLIGGF